MTQHDWKPFALALLGSWPSQVSGWGREAIAAYCAELEARGLTPESAIVALRALGGDFPPSAGELAKPARRDPSRPTFAEAYRLLFEKGGALCKVHVNGVFDTPAHMRSAEHELIRSRLAELHPLIASFVERQGIERLRTLPLEHEQWGEKARRDLEAQWDEHVQTFDGREVAELSSGRREELGRFDPLSALGMKRPELPSGSAA